MDIFSNCGDNITSVCLRPKSARCTPLMHAIFGISTIHHESKIKKKFPKFIPGFIVINKNE